MRTKLKDIFIKSSYMDYDAFVFVETWLTPDYFDAEIFDSKLYNVYRKDRDFTATGLSRGGGVLIAVRVKFLSTSVNLLDRSAVLDQLCVMVSNVKPILYIFVSYIPPNSDVSTYSSHVNNIVHIVNNVDASSIHCVLADFNLPNLNWMHTPGVDHLTPNNASSISEFSVIDGLSNVSLLQINCYYNCLNRLLDLIFVSSCASYTLNKCLLPLSKNVQHHTALVLSFQFYYFPSLSNKRFSKWDFKHANFDLLNEHLSSVDWHHEFNGLNLTQSYDRFLFLFNKLCCDYIPLKEVKVYKVPWYTKNLMKLRNLRNKVYKRYLKSGDISIYYRYKMLCKEFKCYEKHLFNLYMSRIENSIKCNPAYFWSFIKSKKRTSNFPASMFFKEKYADTPFEISNLFADFFVSNFDAQQCLSNESKFLEHVHSKIDFGSLKLSLNDVTEATLGLNSSTKGDIDNICPFLLRNCANSVSVVLLCLFNESLSLGVFINKWKITTVTPIHKKGSKIDVSNYRPIAKTSTVSKIFETIIKKKLVFITKNILSVYQHGFCSGRSTITNLACFSKFCFTALERGNQVDVIYTDLAKAFDKVSHFILLRKLKKMGFHSSFLLWIESFLSGRYCRVSIDNILSKEYLAISGVPQGSILGPLLFNLFINDISQCLLNVNHLLYADDLKIFHIVNNFSDMCVLQDSLNRFLEWCNFNYLYPNASKCLKFSFYRRCSPFLSSYSIDGFMLLTTECVLDLGVLFDRRLSFVDHINYIVPKALAALAFIKRNSRDFMDPHTAKALYFSFVRSRLEYASFIWNPAFDVHSNRIEQLQKNFLKFALRSFIFSNLTLDYNSRCLLLGLQTLRSRRLLNSLLFVYDIVNGSVDSPELLGSINFHVPNRHLRHHMLFYVRHFKSCFACNEPLTRTLILYNNLCNKCSIDFSCSKSNFKSLISNCISFDSL